MSRAARAGLQRGPVRIILVEDRDPGRSSQGAIEQFRLCGEVVLHGAVVIEMIAGEVGEDSHVKMQTGNSFLVESVGGDLHDGLGCAAIHTFAK